MAKTDWTNGSFITPTLMDTYWGTTGATGHTHDSADTDGHVPKINLTGAANVSGLLPVTNIAGSVDSSTVSMTISGTYLADATTFNVVIQKSNKVATVFLPRIYAPTAIGNAALVATLDSTPMPDYMSPKLSGSNTQMLPCTVYNNALLKPGVCIVYPIGGSIPNSFTFMTQTLNTADEYKETHWDSSSGHYKGFPAQSITYITQS